MQEGIGFIWQTYADGACGTFALTHAMLLLGIPVSRMEVNKATGVHPILTRAVGTSSERLKRGIRYLSCKPVECSSTNPDRLKKMLDALLAKGCPAILAVENTDHWAVIARKASMDEYYWIDSADDKLIGSWTWRKIVVWIDCDEYYMLGIVPRDERQLRHSIVPSLDRMHPALREEDLAQYWGYYLEDLLEVFDTPENGAEPVSASEFLKLYGKMLLDAVCHQYLYVDADKMEWELDNYRKVAMAHRLAIANCQIPEAIADLSAACTE